MSYNIRHCRGVDWRVDVQRVADVIRRARPDIICLQEVYEVGLGSEKWRQAIALSKYLGMEVLFDPATGIGPVSWGETILARSRISAESPLRLRSFGEPRICQRTQIEIKGQTVGVLNTHLGLIKYERKQQLCTITKNMDIDRPTILCGDFNAGDAELTNHALGLSPVFINTPTYSSNRPRRALDNILVSKHFKVINQEVISSKASDHLPILAVLSC